MDNRPKMEDFYSKEVINCPKVPIYIPTFEENVQAVYDYFHRNNQDRYYSA